MPKPEARDQGAPIQYFTPSKPTKKDKGNWARQNEVAYNKANAQILAWHAQYAQDKGAPPPNYAQRTNLPPEPKQKFVPSKPEKKKKKTALEIVEAKAADEKAKAAAGTEQAKTEKAKQTRALTDQIVDQLKKDMMVGAVAQNDSLNPGGKKKSWFQRNVADSFAGKAARGLRDSVVGDVAGKALDIISRPTQAQAAFVTSAIEHGANPSSDPLHAPSATPDPRKDPAFKSWTPARQATAIAAYKDIKKKAGPNPFVAAGRAFTGKNPASFTEYYSEKEAAKKGQISTGARVGLAAAGLATDVATDPLNAIGAGIATKGHAARSAEEVIDSSNTAAKVVSAERKVKEAETTARNLPVLASKSAELPQIEANMAEQSRRLSELEAVAQAKKAKSARSAIEIRSATEGGYKALKSETLKQARIVANMERNSKAGKLVEGLDEAKTTLAELNSRYERATKIREAAVGRVAIPGGAVEKLTKQIEDLKVIVKANPGNSIAASRLAKLSTELSSKSAELRKVNLANIPNHAEELLKLVDAANTGGEVKVTKAAADAIASAEPSVQDKLLALIKENEVPHTKAPLAEAPSAKLAGAIDKAGIEAGGAAPSAQTVAEAHQIVADANKSRSAKSIAQGILDQAAERGRQVTPSEQRALLSKELLGKMSESGIEDAALAKTGEKVKAIRAREGATAVSSEMKDTLLQESLAEEILPTMETADKILTEGLQKRFMVRFAGKDLGEFTPVGHALRAAYAPFEFTGRHLANTRVGTTFSKAFKMGSHFPGFTEHLRSMAESHGIVEHSDFTKRIRDAFTGVSRSETKQITKAIDGGYKLDGKLGELQQLYLDESRGIFQKQVAMGKYPPGAEADNYIYHYYRSRNKTAIKAFKDDRTILLRAGHKGPTVEAAKVAGLKPLENIDDILVMQHRDFIRDLQRTNFRQGVVSNYGVLTDNPHFAAQMGLKEVTGQQLNKPFQDLAVAKGAKWYLPPDIHDTFKNMDAMMEIGFNRQANDALEFLDRFTRGFKTSATVGNPGNWVNNTLGDVFLNYLDGVRSPRWYSKAVGLLRHEGEEFPKTMNLGGHSIDGNEIVDLFKRNAPSGGFIRTEGSAFGRNRFVRGTQNMYEAREESVRLAHFLHAFDEEATKATRAGMGWEKAKSVASEIAAKRVAKWNIDYSAITPFERSLRKWVIPFYTFMRKATPLMFEGMVTRPGKFVHYDLAKRAMERMLGAPPEQDDGVVWPFWAKQAGMVRLQGGDEPFFMKDSAPLNVVNRLLGGDQYTDPLANVVNNVNPLIKMPVEIAQQRTLYNQQPITNWGDYLAGQLPTAQIISRAAGQGLNPGDTKTPDRSGLEQVANLAGIPVQRMTFNRQRGEILRTTEHSDYKKQVNSEIAPYYEIKAAHSKTKGDYFNLKDLNTGEIIAKFRDYNMAARRASTLAKEAARRPPQAP